MALKVLELFSGTESFSKVARERGHITFTIDNDKQFNSDLCKDIMDVELKDIPFKPNIIWASPPCQRFSVASISKNWVDGKPKNKETEDDIELVHKTIKLIDDLKPKFWFIENPRGMLRKILELNRVTITYCQYGDSRMKPTDIWTNCYDWEDIAKSCKNGMSCHESAPRGSRTGTQGIKGAKDRSKVPKQLCLEILKICENNDNSQSKLKETIKQSVAEDRN